MLRSLFSRPLKLRVGARTITFPGLADFEFALTCRTEVPAEKLSELVELPAAALKQEARSIRGVEKSFVDLLSQSIQEPGSVGRLLRAVDTQTFSGDHEWRAIMGSLKQQGARFDEFKQVALVKYMQYLRSRQDALKRVYYDKKRRGSGAALDRDPGPSGEDGFRETVIFDAREMESHFRGKGHFVQLPKGESTDRSIPPGGHLEMRLSRHRFTLAREAAHYALADARGDSFPLRPGRNVIGRHQGNHVVIDASYRDISRKHLIVEIVNGGRVRLTDLSSHGTYVQADSPRAGTGALD